MRVAIVIPVLDEAVGIAATLAPLQPLRAAGHKIIVADGGSRDRTVDVATPLCDHVLHASRGRARQMNAGAAAAANTASAPAPIDAYLFLHADTQLPTDAMDLVVAALLSGARWGRFDVRIAGRSRWLPVVATLMNVRSRLTGIATGDQAIFVDRAAFDAVHGFPDWPLMEDIGLSRSLKRLSRPAALRARVVTSGRRWDGRGPLRTIALMWWLRLRFALGARPEALAARYATVR
jgi:rSAM/selenodomain-associated transferase 2